jgi:hypothetical protein
VPPKKESKKESEEQSTPKEEMVEEEEQSIAQGSLPASGLDELDALTPRTVTRVATEFVNGAMMGKSGITPSSSYIPNLSVRLQQRYFT